MEPEEDEKSGSNLKIVIAIVAVLLILGVGLIVPIVPDSVTILVVTQSADVLSNVIPEQVVQTQTSNIFSLTQQTIKGGSYLYTSAQLSEGGDASITWSADDSLNVYVFSSSQFSNYQNSNNQQNVAFQSGGSGTLGFHVSVTDTYYFVFYNNHNGILGIGAHNVGLYSASGTWTFQSVVTEYSTQYQTVFNTYTVQSTTTCNAGLIHFGSVSC